jgi:PIN domain nuclease of toxin-antitoxin system
MAAVLDSSAVLAVLFNEKGAEIVSGHIAEGAIMSSVNLAEVASKLNEIGYSDEQLEISLFSFASTSVEFDARQAMASGKLRKASMPKGLSLGDRCCLALAELNNSVAVTADRAWLSVREGIEIELIRP